MEQAHSIDGLSKQLLVSKKTTRRLVISGELKGHRIGRQWRVFENDLRDYLERQTNQPIGGSERHVSGGIVAGAARVLLGLLFCFVLRAQILGPILFAPPSASVAPYSLIQQIPSGSTCASTTATPSFSCVMSSNITAGHRLFIMTGIGINSGEQFSSATGCSSTWTSIKKSTTDAYAEILYCSNATGGSTTVTITMTGNCGAGPYYSCSANVSEWSGGSGTVDQTNTAAAINNSPTTGSITTTVANELILAMTATSNTGTLSSGPTNSFTSLVANSTNPLVLFAYRVVSATGTYSTGWTLSGASAGWDAPIASFE